MKTDTSKWPQWLKDAVVEHAIVEINEFGTVIWQGGEWQGGVWQGGVWQGGVWRDGVWRGGVWQGGEWQGGVWRDGVWRGGVWRDGVWQGGVWRDGVWQGGEWQGGVWQGGVWQGIKGDFFDVLLRVPHEVPGLIAALKEGRVDGSTYTGQCPCLVGTIANLQGCEYTAVPDLVPDSNRPIERFFMSIRKGDTPETNPWCKAAVAWAEEFQQLIARISGKPIEVDA